MKNLFYLIMLSILFFSCSNQTDSDKLLNMEQRLDSIYSYQKEKVEERKIIGANSLTFYSYYGWEKIEQAQKELESIKQEMRRISISSDTVLYNRVEKKYIAVAAIMELFPTLRTDWYAMFKGDELKGVKYVDSGYYKVAYMTFDTLSEPFMIEGRKDETIYYK